MAVSVNEFLARIGKAPGTVAEQAQAQECLDAALGEISSYLSLQPSEVSTADWLFSTVQTAADPGAGKLRFDKANPQAVASIYVSETSAGGVSYPLPSFVSGDLLRLGDALTPDTRWLRYVLTAPAVDHGTWDTLPVNLEDTSVPALEPAEGQRLTLNALRPTVLLGRKAALVDVVTIERAAEHWRLLPFGALPSGADLPPVLTARDSFYRHARKLQSLKSSWGLA